MAFETPMPPTPETFASDGVRRGTWRDSPRLLWWAQGGFWNGARRAHGLNRFASVVSGVLWWPLYPLLLLVQVFLMARSRATYYLTDDAVLGITTKSDGWHITDHVTREPGKGQGMKLRDAVLRPLIEAADLADVPVFATAATPQMARQYAEEVPGLEPRHGRGRRLARGPRGRRYIEPEQLLPRLGRWVSERSLPAASLLAAGALLFMGAAAVWLTGLSDPDGGWGWHVGSLEWKERLTYGAAVAAGLGAVVALVVNYRKQRDAEESKFAVQFAEAAAQLGNDAPAVRIAGAFAVAALADRHRLRRQQCVDLLTGYLRLPYSPEASRNHLVTSSVQRTSNEADGGQSTRTSARAFRPADREVRLTIIRIIRDRLLDPHASATWSGLDLDFTGATFDGGDFRRATFSGKVSFGGARFSGGSVSFGEATFSGPVSFGEATFSGSVSFGGATFSGTVSFADARISGPVFFDAARFSGGSVSFSGAMFSGGTVSFDAAMFSGGTVSFSGAMLSGGTVTFDAAMFNGGTVSFGPAMFSGGTTVFFRGAIFSGGAVTFRGAMFNGGSVSFGGAMFSGGTTVSFDAATFASGFVSFRLATFSGGSVSFDSARFSGGIVSFRRARFSGGTVTRDGNPFSGWVGGVFVDRLGDAMSHAARGDHRG